MTEYQLLRYPAPGARGEWDGFARYAECGRGVICVFRNDYPGDTVNVRLPQELPSGLIATSALNDADLSWLKRRKIPFCAFNAYRRHQVNQVRFDYAEAARAGLRYLAGCGCRRIVLCGGHFEQENDAAIYGNNLFRDGILAAAQEISPGPELCFYEIPQTHEGGARLALELWKSGIRPDAFFTTDPLPALGIQAAGKVRNRNDFELITCHGLPDHPEITSLRSPLADMGKAAVDMVIGACKGDPAKVRQKIFAPELIEAKSEVFSL